MARARCRTATVAQPQNASELLSSYSSSGSFAMPRKPWEPTEEERHRFHEVYIDESSQNGHHFLVHGGIIIPRELSADFEADMISARRRPLNSKGQHREMGWSEISNHDFHEYERVLDAFFSYPRRRVFRGVFRFYCSVIDTTVCGRTYSVGKRGHIGYNRELYFHCMSIARHERGPLGPLFHIYPDERTTSEPIEELKDILNNGIRKEGDKRIYPFRRVTFRKSHEHQALQISDILIGAVAFRLNRKYDAPNANGDKKRLCDYILGKTGFNRYIKAASFRQKGFGPYQLWYRKHKNI
jgi:hypothetical protein